jgi:hypothetical protein
MTSARAYDIVRQLEWLIFANLASVKNSKTYIAESPPGMSVGRLGSGVGGKGDESPDIH